MKTTIKVVKRFDVNSYEEIVELNIPTIDLPREGDMLVIPNRSTSEEVRTLIHYYSVDRQLEKVEIVVL